MQRTALLTYIVINTLVFAFTATDAATHKKYKHHHIYGLSGVELNAAPQRVCDWIGPGARAVYRCTYVNDPPPTVAMSTQPSCDWIGPGARALYRCK